MKMKDPWMGDENEYRYKYNGIEEVDDFGLDLSFATFRTLDPSIGRWLQVDPYASSFASLNPYNSMGNNPISIVDPNGDFIGNIVGAAVGVAVNGIGNTIKGDPFFQGWVGAAIAGAVSGGSGGGGLGSVAGNFGSQAASGALNGAISAVNGHLPSVGLNIGSFSLSVSPSLMLGNGGFGIGANASASVDSKIGSFGISAGATYWGNHAASGGKSFLETRVSQGIAIGPRGFRIGIGSARFSGGDFSQTSGSLNISGRGWSVAYDNDWLFGTGLGDGGDRWRTGGFRINVGEVSLGVNVFTGDPQGLSQPARDKYVKGGFYIHPDANKYRSGILTLGYGNARIGVSSERIRAGFQNSIHKWIGKPYFKFKSYGDHLYGSYQTSNPYTIW